MLGYITSEKKSDDKDLPSYCPSLLNKKLRRGLKGMLPEKVECSEAEAFK